MPPGEFNIMILEPLSVYFESFIMTAVTIFAQRCNGYEHRDRGDQKQNHE